MPREAGVMRVVRVLAPNPSVHTLEGTNTWVVGQDPALVIDPGPDDDGHLAEVLTTAGRIEAVLVSHDHPDHAPGGPVLARAAGVPLLAFRPPTGGERLRDGQVVRAGDVALRVVHAPGHTTDHVVLFAEEEGALFTGDAVLGRGTSVIDPPEGELAAYLRSLKRMLELAPRTIYPGHGPVVFDAPAKLSEYLDHRAEREEQVLAALGEGARTTADLVSAIYADHPPEFHPLAERSVLAHLLKLEADGRLAHAGRGARATYELIEPRDCDRCGRPVRGRGRLCDRCRLAMLQETPGPQEDAAT